MRDNAIAAGMDVSYVLMDSWCTFVPLIQKVLNREMAMIVMVKGGNQGYRFEG